MGSISTVTLSEIFFALDLSSDSVSVSPTRFPSVSYTLTQYVSALSSAETTILYQFVESMPLIVCVPTVNAPLPYDTVQLGLPSPLFGVL